MFQLIPFTREFCGDDANQTAAEFQFVCLGEITQAVVLRLASDLPRIYCETSSTERRTPEEVSR